MATTKIRGNTQIMDATIGNAQIATDAAIATTKLADGANFLQKDGSVAMTANFDANSNKVINLAEPTNDNDAARKIDVDRATAGLDVKDSCRCATTAEIALATDLEAGDSIDGVTLVAGDRVLVKNQTTNPEENGIYVAVASGAASRSTDADESSEVTAGLFTFVAEGTQADTGWVLTTNDPITLDTTELAFAQFSGSGSAVTGASNVGTGGQGLYKQLSSNTLQFYNIDAGDGTIDVSLNAGDNEVEIKVASDSITNTQINSAAAIARSKLGTGTADYVVINDGSGNFSEEATLAVSRGGTNSGTALNNNRVMVSSSGAIVEAAAITASRALESDANGIPVASSVTATELGYVSGVTSAIQTQIDAKLAKALTDTYIFVGNGSNEAAGVAMSGDATIANDGTVSLASDVIKEADFVVRETPSGLINGANTTYTLANTPTAGTEQVFLNGLLQDEGASDDYTISGGTITYNTAPQTGDRLVVSYMK